RAQKMEGLRDEAQEQRGLAERRGGQEQIQRERAEANEAGIRRLLYLLRINMADRAWHQLNMLDRAWHQRHIDQILELLEGEPRELRGFEWHCLCRLAQTWRLAQAWRLAQPGSPTEVLLTLKGHTAPATAVAFSPQGQRLASTSFDKTVKIWDARTGQETL